MNTCLNTYPLATHGSANCTACSRIVFRFNSHFNFSTAFNSHRSESEADLQYTYKTFIRTLFFPFSIVRSNAFTLTFVLPDPLKNETKFV